MKLAQALLGALVPVLLFPPPYVRDFASISRNSYVCRHS